MSKIIDNKLERLFTPSMTVGGYLLMGMSLAVFYEGVYFAGLLFILVGGFVSFANNGIQINPDSMMSKQYIGYLGLRLGKWKSMEQYSYITILRSRETTTTFSRSNRATTSNAELFYDITLVDKTHRQKLGIKRVKDEKQTIADAKELVKILGFEFVKYNPEVSEQTRARRKRGRA
ncbi:MAG: hypothetical protein KAG64_01010 [Bacteroidales bacterium]|nr:hypothetical protein [Bacteroidales bacterium]